MSLEVVQLPIKKKKIWERVSSNLVVHLPSGIYYVRKKQVGRDELFQSTGEKNKRAAETKALEMISDWLNGKTFKRSERKFISEICDELDLCLQKEFENNDRRIRTREHDKTYFRIIKNHFGDRIASDIDEVFWDDWVRSTGRSLNRSLSDIAKYLSKVLTFAFQRKYINRKPEIRNPDKPKKSGMVYENADIEVFLEHADPMLRDLIIIGAECGLRPHENLGLQWEWIQFDKERVIIHIPADFSKTKSPRSLEASPNAAALLRQRFEKRVGPFVFPAPRNTFKSLSKKHMGKIWHAMLKRAGYPSDLKFHWLRHSFFTKTLLDAKLPLAEVSQYGGNSPNILMKRYLQDDPRRTSSVARAINLSVKKV